MSRLLGIILLYLAMFSGWTMVGTFLLIAPERFGNLFHESFGLFPPVAPRDRGKKLILRLAGAAILAFAARFAFAVVALVR